MKNVTLFEPSLSAEMVNSVDILVSPDDAERNSQNVKIVLLRYHEKRHAVFGHPDE